MGRPNAGGHRGGNAILGEPRLTAKLEFKGTPLSEDDIEKGRVLSVFYRPKAKYSWSTGIAIGRFLQELRNGRIIGRICDKCGRKVVPPRIFCEWCFRRNDDWIVVPDRGTIATYSVSYIATDASRMKRPTIPAVIQLDETSNAGILHMVSEVEPEAVKIGMRVRAVWRPPRQRTGSILDIKHFRPE